MQSHALSFFHLSSPDLLLGMDADPAKTQHLRRCSRRIPQLARDGIRLRQFGQQIIERLGGKRIHPAWVVPGGVSEPLSRSESRRHSLNAFPKRWPSPSALSTGSRAPWKVSAKRSPAFGNFPTLFMGIVKDDGGLTFYDGKLRIVDAAGHVVADGLDPAHTPITSARKSSPGAI